MGLALAAALSVTIAAFGGSIAMGILGSKAVESIARQPEAAGDIRTIMFITLAFIETLTIYGLLIAFMVVGKM
jgi:F-type H+-transporting ATPase subunit c